VGAGVQAIQQAEADPILQAVQEVEELQPVEEHATTEYDP
jgi:hypothetical protein